MRYHPTRTRRLRVTRYPTRQQLSPRTAAWVGVAMVLLILLACSL